jgi:4,5-DOPA dioxygenase extradiol
MGKVDILVIVSSSTVHNLRTVDWNSKKAEEWAVEFGFVEWIGDVN